jgi:predicted nuclease with TOPRIM domain
VRKRDEVGNLEPQVGVSRRIFFRRGGGGMEKDLSKALIDFYHKLLQPEFAGIKEKLKENDGKFMEMLGHLDGVHKRLDNLEAEYHCIHGGLARLEKRHDRLEMKVDGIAADLTAHRHDTEAHRKGWRVREE